MVMTEDWSCISQKDTDPYAQICIEAVNDDSKFQNFKRDSRYTAILEHVPYEQGRQYVETIQQYEIEKEFAIKLLLLQLDSLFICKF